MSLPILTPQLSDAAAARDLLLCARSRSRPTLFLCGNSHMTEPFVVDDVVWGFSRETLRHHVQSTSLMERLRTSIDLVFINASSCVKNNNNNMGHIVDRDIGIDLRRLSLWESVLTHFVFLINTDLSGNLQVMKNRITYHLPLFNKGGKTYILEIFIHEDTEIPCCDCGNGSSNDSTGSVRWDLVCSITQRHSVQSCEARQCKQSKQPLSSVLYAGSWTDDVLVDACVVLEDERNPLVAFIALAHVFLAAGVPKGMACGNL